MYADSPPMLPPSATALKRNFLRMTCFFAINHGCVVAVLTLSVLLLGKKPGAFQSAVLYVSYAACALLLSTPIISVLGSRKALIAGSAIYCVYVGSVPLALVVQSEAGLYAVALIGGAVGGIAAGFLWAAQGAYFAANASLFATAAGVSCEEANGTFAALFGAVFLGFELVLKLVPLGVDYIPVGGEPFHEHTLHIGPNCTAAPAETVPGCKALPLANLAIACVYAACAVGAVAGLLTIADVEALKGAAAAHAEPLESEALIKPRARRFSLAKLIAAVALWSKEPVVLLLAPVQAAFGVAAALLAYNVSGGAVPHVFPKGGKVEPLLAASLLSALVPLTAMCLQLPFKAFAARWSKTPLMLAGLVAFATLGLVCLIVPADAFSLALLVLAFLLQGVGRACYEGVNKALYADSFPEDTQAAFANMILASGGASAVAYFLFPEMPGQAQAATALLVALWAIYSYSVADLYARRNMRRTAVA